MQKQILARQLFQTGPGLKADLVARAATVEVWKELEDVHFTIGSVVYTASFRMLLEAVRSIATVSQERDVTFHDVKKIVDDHPFMVEVVEPDRDIPQLISFPSLALHKSQDWPGADVAPGVVTILGDMFAGKTHYMRHAKSIDVIVRYGEPSEDIDYDEISIPAASFAEAINFTAVLSALGLKVGLDSIRRVVYGLSGAALKGGVTASFFDVLTDLNNLFAAIGSTVMIAVNPMLSDVSDMERMFARVGACVAGAVWLTGNGEIGDETYRCMGGRRKGALGLVNNEKPTASRSSLVSHFMDTEEGEMDSLPGQFGLADSDCDDKNEERHFPNLPL